MSELKMLSCSDLSRIGGVKASALLQALKNAGHEVTLNQLLSLEQIVQAMAAAAYVGQSSDSPTIDNVAKLAQVTVDSIVTALHRAGFVDAKPEARINWDHVGRALASLSTQTSARIVGWPFVSVQEMRESNGQRSWSVWLSNEEGSSPIFGDGVRDYQVGSSMVEGRAQYMADELRAFFRGDQAPDIMLYDTEYPKELRTVDMMSALTEMKTQEAERRSSVHWTSQRKAGYLQAIDAALEVVAAFEKSMRPYDAWVARYLLLKIRPEKPGLDSVYTQGFNDALQLLARIAGISIEPEPVEAQCLDKTNVTGSDTVENVKTHDENANSATGSDSDESDENEELHAYTSPGGTLYVRTSKPDPQLRGVEGPQGKFCIFCDKGTHSTDECESTQGLNTPYDRELMRLAEAARAFRPKTKPEIMVSCGVLHGLYDNTLSVQAREAEETERANRVNTWREAGLFLYVYRSGSLNHTPALQEEPDDGVWLGGRDGREFFTLPQILESVSYQYCVLVAGREQPITVVVRSPSTAVKDVSDAVLKTFGGS